MTRQTLVVPGEMPGLNQTIERAKRHWSQYTKQKKQWTRFVALLARMNLKPVQGQVSLSITWVCKDRRRDPDNIVAGGRKIILDGLVEAGILRGDGWKQISSFTDHFDVDKAGPRVEVTLNAVQHNKKSA